VSLCVTGVIRTRSKAPIAILHYDKENDHDH
jgi:hypothetical protein